MIVIHRSAEARLIEALNELQEQSAQWTALVFHLSELLEEYRGEYHRTIAVNLLSDLLRNHDGGIFLFADGRIAVLASHASSVLINKIVFQLRYLYMDDPLAYVENGEENASFCTIYRLGSEWKECMDFCTRSLTRSARSTGQMPARIAKAAHFNPTRLATIERDLTQIDIAAALRRQPVCAALPNGSIRRVFDELYINITHLRQLLKAEVDLFSNRWLFKYLTQLLDERVLSRLASGVDRHLAQPVSLNLNCEALLSERFSAFDAALSQAQKVGVVFEIPVVDVFADMAAFAYARDMVQQKGYRVCIDGLSAASFLHVDRERLKADLVKLQWNADSTADLQAQANRDLASAIRRCGANRIILCRCDNKAAVDYGQAFGISLFQGRYLDGLLNPSSKVEN